MEKTLTQFSYRHNIDSKSNISYLDGLAFFHGAYLIASILSLVFWGKLSVPVFIIICGLSLRIIFRRQKWLFSYFSIAFLISFFVMTLTYYAFQLAYGSPYLIGGSDDYHFEEVAELYNSNLWFNFTEIHGYSTNDTFYVFIVQLLMLFGKVFDGYHTVLPRLLNVFASVVILGQTLFIAKYRKGCSRSTINRIALFYILNVYFFYVADMISRDAIGVLFAMAVYLCISNIKLKRKIVLNIVYLLFILFFSYYLRHQLLPIFLAYMLIYIVFNIKKKNALIIGGCVVLLGVLGLIVSQRIGFLTYVTQYFDTYQTYQSDRGGLTGTIISLPLLPIGWILRIGLGLIYPFPSFKGLIWDANNILLNTILILSYLYEFVVFISIPKIIRAFKRDKENVASYLYYLCLFCLLTFTFRHFIFAVPFYCLMMGRERASLESNCWPFIMTVLYIALQFAYIIL